MKAKDKKTGEIVEIERFGADGSYTVIIDFRFYKEPICGVETLLQCEVNFKGGVDKIHNCHIINVHEIQHALTICGIEKKIEI